MLSIVYASSAVRLFNRAELIELLEASHQANQEHGITGMLLYRGGNFIQVIEGENEAVIQLYENIKADPRHNNIILLSQDPILERQFADWSMGFRNIDQMTRQELEGFSEFWKMTSAPIIFGNIPPAPTFCC